MAQQHVPCHSLSQNKTANMKEKPYKGHGSYLTEVAKFCAIYELEINRRTIREKEFSIAFPRCFSRFKQTIKKHIATASSEEIPKVLTKKHITLAFNVSSCQIYDLCRHIRNSFSHMLLEIDTNDRILIIDKYHLKQTSSGSLNKSEFLEFIRCLIVDYETSHI